MSRVHLYSEPTPLFDKFDIESEIRDLFKARVELPTGGSLVIQPTEALVSIDVNTGRYTGKKDPEKTILRTNLEAAREIARQIRLRDIGGIIVCDFIDMETQVQPGQGAPGAADPSGPRSGPHQGPGRVGAGPGGDDPPAGAPVAVALDDHRLPDLRRHRPGLHARSGGAAAGAVASSGRDTSAAERQLTSGCTRRWRSTCWRRSPSCCRLSAQADRAGSRAPGRPDDAAGRVPADEPAGGPGRDGAVRGGVAVSQVTDRPVRSACHRKFPARPPAKLTQDSGTRRA